MKHVAYIGTLLVILISSSCTKKKHRDEMSLPELEERAVALVEQGRREDAAETLQTIIVKHGSSPNIGKYKLLLAEMYFKMGEYEQARTLYDHFYQIYPADPRADYAQYQSIRSQFNQTLRLDCDQAPTIETISLCKNYLVEQADHLFQDDVREIKKTCEYKLIDKEVYIFDFYLKRQEFKAAEGRLAYLKETFLDDHDDLQARILYLECKLAHHMNNQEQRSRSFQKLLDEYPESHYTNMAQSLIEKKIVEHFDFV